jgi:hypothetical protein
MANPLESYGWSDRDYETTIGALMGEAGTRATGQALVNEMAGILDVAENRRSSARTGGGTFRAGTNPTLADVFEARRQFDAVTRPGNPAHNQQYQPGRRAALDEEYAATLTASQRERLEAAKQAALGIASRELRGISKNATITSSAAAGPARSQRGVHNKEGLRTATRIGGTNFYGKGHSRNLTREQAVSIANQRDKTAAARSRAPVDTPLERNLPGMMESRRDYSQFGKEGTPKEAIPPEARAPYSPSGLNFGPDFTSPPSQARGPVTDPYGFSNVNTAVEAAPGSFAGYGPNAFGALDQAALAQTYPELSAGLYPDIAPPNVPAVPDIMGQFDPTNFMTEQQAIENANLEGQRLSENVERRQAPFGESVDEQVERNAAATEQNDYLSALYSEIMGPLGTVRDNPTAYTTNPYEVGSYVAPERVDKGIWGGTTPFNDRFTGRATPTFQDYENRAPLAGLGLGPMGSAGPVGMAKAGGVELQRDISGISSGMHPYEAVFEAVRNAPTTAQMSAGAPPTAPGYVGGTTAQLGTPDFAAASALDREAAYQADVAAMRDPAAAAARGAWADQAEAGPRPAGPDPTSFQGGLYGDPATPAGGFTPGLDYSTPLGPSPDRFSGGPAETAFNSRMSEALQPGPAAPAEMTPFQNTPLGVGAGIIDQGPYSSPIGGLGKSFSPANLAVSTQAPEIIGYEPGKAITREVPNPAWSDWSKDYATKNAVQDAWAAADEDKRAWDHAPPNPSVLADTRWAGLGKEPPKTIPGTKVAAPTPIYSKPEVAAAVRAAPVASVPAVNAQPVAGSAIQAQPSTWTPGMTAQANAFSSLLGSIGGYGLQGVQGTFDTGFNLAGMGGGYGNFGGGYDPGGYGGYGGISPGDAGYGSDARSGSGNMGAGNLYS